MGNGNTRKIVEKLSKAFSALTEAYGACEAGEWELFKEKYTEFFNSIRGAVKDRRDLTFLNALVAEVLLGKFIEHYDLPKEVWEWLEGNFMYSSDNERFKETMDYCIDAYACLVDELIELEELKLDYGYYIRLPLISFISALETLRPMDPRTWINAWRVWSKPYRALKERGGEVDERRLSGLRNRLKEYLLKAFALDPENDVVKWRLGNLYFEEGNYDEAIKYYELINEKGKYMVEDLSEAYKCIGNYEKAIEVLQYGIKEYPYRFDFHRRLFELYMEIGEVEEAKKTIEMLLQLPKEVTDANFARILEYNRTLAECYEKVGDIENAIKYLERVEGLYRERIKQYDKREPYRVTLEEWLGVRRKIEELSRKLKR